VRIVFSIDCEYISEVNYTNICVKKYIKLFNGSVVQRKIFSRKIGGRS